MLDPDTAAITVRDLRPCRDYYLYVSDLRVAAGQDARCRRGGVYNAGSGESRSVQWIVDTVGELAGIRKPIQSTGQPRTKTRGIRDVVADVSRAGRDLDWRPATGLHDGLARTIVWMRTALAAER